MRRVRLTKLAQKISRLIFRGVGCVWVARVLFKLVPVKKKKGVEQGGRRGTGDFVCCTLESRGGNGRRVKKKKKSYWTIRPTSKKEEIVAGAVSRASVPLHGPFDEQRTGSDQAKRSPVTGGPSRRGQCLGQSLLICHGTQCFHATLLANPGRLYRGSSKSQERQGMMAQMGMGRWRNGGD